MKMCTFISMNLKKNYFQFIYFRLKTVFGQQFFYENVYFYFNALKK